MNYTRKGSGNPGDREEENMNPGRQNEKKDNGREKGSGSNREEE